MTDNAAVSPDASGGSLGSKAARGAAWSGLGTIVLRMGSLVVGIVLARVLTPEQFGVFAVALTVQSILMTVADLGLSADLVRSEEPERIAPTVASMGLITGAVAALVTAMTAPILATSMGSPESAAAIAVLSMTLFLAGVSVVPYATLLRNFQQRELFWISVADFIVYTTLTLTLVFAGWGVMSMALGRVAAQTVSSCLQFVVTRSSPTFALDREMIRPILSFGVPIAAANLVGIGLQNVATIVLARMAGVSALGYYVLANNVSSWPMSAMSQIVRAVSLPYFSRATNPTDGLTRFIALGWALALPAGGLLAVLSVPVISILYGERWLPAAPVLAALGFYGALRVVFDIVTGFLYARGRSRPVFWIQLVWIATLVAALVAVIPRFGLVGAGWVHVIIAALIVLPAYLLALQPAGVNVGSLVRAVWWPTISAVAALAAALVTSRSVSGSIAQLSVGGAAAALVYSLFMWRWARQVAGLIRRTPGPEAPVEVEPA